METLGHIDFWRLLAGLGIFLFAMFMMEESIKLLAGRAFNSLIRRYTATRVRGILAGIISTAILQSSSAVSLMVLAFAGAGLMKLRNGLAVMIGTKVGTTMTAWIVAVFGFKFEIEAFALPMIGIGGLGLIFLAHSVRYVNISKLLVAFGFLFHGLDFMKTSVEGLTVAIDFGALPELGLGVYLLAGLLLTAIMQSSSATIAITLTMLYTGALGFNEAMAVVVGANVGTTVTVLLGSIGAIQVKKQAALGQLIFTTSTAAVAFLLLSPLSCLILYLLDFADSPVLGLAFFHTMFNVMGVIMFYPLIPWVTTFVQRLLPEREPLHLTRYINKTSPEVAEAAIEALRKEIINQGVWGVDFVRMTYEIKAATGRTLGQISYADIQRLHAEIFTFYAKTQAKQMEEEEARLLEPYIRASRSIMNAVANLYEQQQELLKFRYEDDKFMQDAGKLFLDRLSLAGEAMDKVGDNPDLDHSIILREAFLAVEEADKRFIRACASQVAEQKIKEEDVTRLLMANRFFTQSCRMLVLSLQSLQSLNKVAARNVSGLR